MDDFLYWRYNTPVGVRVEQVSGEAVTHSEKVWMYMARQIWAENGGDNFREIGHFASGAPFLYGSEQRISVSHTKGMFLVAMLPRTPEQHLGEFALRTALGVDVERIDRQQAQRCRQRFLNDDELSLVDDSDVALNVLAWTIKEAMLKASMNPSIDFRNDIVITQLPTPVNAECDKTDNIHLGRAYLFREDNGQRIKIPFTIYSRIDGEHLITIAVAEKAAKFSA